MPPVRSTRSSSSIPSAASTASASKDEVAAVPPFKDFKARLKWACNLRGVDPSSFTTSISTKASSSGKRQSRLWCRLCRESVEGDQKTMDRHLETNTHLLRLAEELRVDFQSLRSPPMPCRYCKKGIAGARKDSLKRHEENCKNNPARGQSAPVRTASLSHLNETRERRSAGTRALGRAVSMPTALPSRGSSSRVPASSSRESPAESSASRRPLPEIPQTPSTPPSMHGNMNLPPALFDHTTITPTYYSFSAPHVRPPSLSVDFILSALRQPVLTIRHSTEYELLPPPFFSTDPLLCLGPTAAGFESDLETLSGTPPGWDWLIGQDLLT